MISAGALDELRARNPVAEVAQQLGARLKRAGRTMMGTCPVCGGGKTAQRFEIKGEQWVCAVCADGGDVISLVQKVKGLDFRGAVEWLGGARVLDPAEEARIAHARADRDAKREHEAAQHREDERQRLWHIWDKAQTQAAPLAAYLVARGIRSVPVTLRFVPDMPFYHGEVEGPHGRKRPRRIHIGPAMIAAYRRPDDAFGGLHITWLAPNALEKARIVDPDTGEAIGAKKIRGAKAAGRIELVGARHPRRLVLGEGIETALSAWQSEASDGVTAYWSALDLGNLGGPAAETVQHPSDRLLSGQPRRLPGAAPDWTQPALPLPESVDELILLGDGDSDPFDTRTAIARAINRHSRPGRVVRIAWAPRGADLNDVLRGKCKHS